MRFVALAAALLSLSGCLTTEAVIVAPAPRHHYHHHGYAAPHWAPYGPPGHWRKVPRHPHSYGWRRW